MNGNVACCLAAIPYLNGFERSHGESCSDFGGAMIVEVFAGKELCGLMKRSNNEVE